MFQQSDIQYMQRCIQLAQLGAGYVSPNPMVGAILVHNHRIIGEGWHQVYGKGHAEVNCINSVKECDKDLIEKSTLFVNLEPCAHYGKTPPCAQLIIDHKIPKVIIGCTDSFDQVSGKGIAMLQRAGITVILGVLEQECLNLNRRFFTRQEQKRPYVILKWAQSSDGFIAPEHGQKVMLSNKLAQQYVQKMRSEEDAILIGYNTAEKDNPLLNNRWGNKHTITRIVFDPELHLPQYLNLFDQSQPTIVFNFHKEGKDNLLSWKKIEKGKPIAQQILANLPTHNSIIVEGGTKTLEQFIKTQLWDEAIIISTSLHLNRGIKAPFLHNHKFSKSFSLANDTVQIFSNNSRTTLNG